MGVSTDVLAGSPQGEHHKAPWSGVDELAAHGSTHPHHAVWAKHMLNALHEQAQLALQHDVDLVLLLMRMNTPALAGLEHDQIHAKRAHAELAAQRLEALAAVAIESGERNLRVGHHLSIGR